MENFSERINRLVSVKAKSVSEFGRMIGVNQVTMNRYIQGRVPSVECLVAITNTFPDVSAEWLLTGEGEMYKSNGGTAIVNDNKRQFGVTDNSVMVTGAGAPINVNAGHPGGSEYTYVNTKYYEKMHDENEALKEVVKKLEKDLEWHKALIAKLTQMSKE